MRLGWAQNHTYQKKHPYHCWGLKWTTAPVRYVLTVCWSIQWPWLYSAIIFFLSFPKLCDFFHFICKHCAALSSCYLIVSMRCFGSCPPLIFRQKHNYKATNCLHLIWIGWWHYGWSWQDGMKSVNDFVIFYFSLMTWVGKLQKLA